MTASLMPASLPDPRQLAALGTVLCLYRPDSGGELGSWGRAQTVACETTLDSEGLREALVFHDAQGRACWQLCLLPDTDFLAWERLVSSLPVREQATTGGDGLAERLWRRLATRVAGDAWHASVLRLHAMPGGPGFASLASLAASLAPLSPLGAKVVRRINRDTGAMDDCCCHQADSRATMAAPRQGDESAPLIRFHVRMQA